MSREKRYHTNPAEHNPLREKRPAYEVAQQMGRGAHKVYYPIPPAVPRGSASASQLLPSPCIGRRFININTPLSRTINGQEFSVMSYNVLCDKLMQLHPDLYRGSPAWCLEWAYRRVNLINEIVYYGAQVICLQEVQCHHYDDWFQPQLAQHGYVGIYKQRCGDKVDGCALFVKETSFHVIDVRRIEFSERNIPSLSRDNVGIVALLKPRGGSEDNCVCIATTHLLFNPKRGDIKLLQIASLLAEANEVACLAKDSWRRRMYGATHHPIVVCGDFNCKPESPLYNFVASGVLQYEGMASGDISAQRESHERKTQKLQKRLIPQEMRLSNNCAWLDGSTSNDTVQPAANKAPGNTQSSSSTADNDSGVLCHQLNLNSVYCHTFPDGSCEVTTCHSRCCCTVDYMFYSGLLSAHGGRDAGNGKHGLVVTGLVSLMSEQNLRRHGPMPGPALSSDHLPLVARFKLC